MCPGTVTTGAFITTASPVPLKTARGAQQDHAPIVRRHSADSLLDLHKYSVALPLGTLGLVTPLKSFESHFPLALNVGDALV